MLLLPCPLPLRQMTTMRSLESIEMIELFANQAAIAIDSVRIFQEREAERVILEEAMDLLRRDVEQVQYGDLRVRV